MSRQIDLDKRLSEEDRRYLEARDNWSAIARADGTTVEEVHANMVNYGKSEGKSSRRSHVEAIDADADTKGGRQSESEPMTDEEWVASLSVAQLKDEIKKIDPEASTQGNKEALQATLLDLLESEEE